jgi:hypothetical protein
MKSRLTNCAIANSPLGRNSGDCPGFTRLRKTLLKTSASDCAVTWRKCAVGRHWAQSQWLPPKPVGNNGGAVNYRIKRATLALFQPLATAILRSFADKRLCLLLDPTDLASDLTLVMVAIAYRGRAVPLAWLTVYIKPDTVKEAVQLLFTQLQAWLPLTAKVHLIADREFRGQEMLALIQAYGWTPVVRLKGDTRVTLPDETQCRVRDLAPVVGHTAFYPRVWLTMQACGPYSLSLSTAPPTKPGKKPAPWYIVSTEPASQHILTLDAKRMWVEMG